MISYNDLLDTCEQQEEEIQRLKEKIKHIKKIAESSKTGIMMVLEIIKICDFK